MKMILLALVCLSFNFAYADRFQGRVNSIDLGQGEESHLVKLDNARVIFLDGADKKELEHFQRSLETQEVLDVVVDKTNSLLSVESTEGVAEEAQGPVAIQSYEPTVVSSMDEARSIFKRMRRDYQYQSQCYNRAHIWAYEEFQNSGLRSMKLFMFFTNSYIRRYRYHWWFHVTPMIYVNTGDSVVERTLDRRYTASPLDLKSWTDIFIYSKRTCPKVERYSDYRDHQESEDCYLIPVSMYFWQPRDILYRDEHGTVKTMFYRSEVNWAYWEAF